MTAYTQFMATATLTATVWREGGAYVSLCPELGVASCGSDPEDAIGMLREAVELYLENAAALGILEDIQPMLESPFRLSGPLEVAVP